MASDAGPPEDATTVLEVDDHDWLGQADWIIGGEAARRARRQGIYAGYVLLLFAAIYGFPLVQALFRTTDREWLRDQVASPAGLAVITAGVVAVLASALWAGRIRGPVVPPLPWIDLVLAAPIDRALGVRRWWRFAVIGLGFVGGIVGLVLGSGLAFAQVTGAVAMGGVALAGVLIGLAAARLWLWSQAWSGPRREGVGRRPWRVPDTLRTLHAEALRRHSANTSTLAGSALTGNLRSARLAFAPAVRRARGSRLRPGRPVPVIVRRDVLGLRRQPAALLSGAALVVLGAVVVTWALTRAAAPPIAFGIGMVPLYLGFGSWAEGLRLQADNIGTPSLIGVGPLTQAAAHLAMPATLTLGALGMAAGLHALAGGAWAGRSATVLAALVLLVALLGAGHLLAAFRGSPTAASGPTGMVLWYLRPVTLVVVLGAVTCYVLREGLVGAGVGAGGAVAAMVGWGLARVQRLTHLHRSQEA